MDCVVYMETYSLTDTQKQQNKYPAVSSERWYRDNVTEDPEAHLSDGQRDGIPSSGQIMPWKTNTTGHVSALKHTHTWTRTTDASVLFEKNMFPTVSRQAGEEKTLYRLT